MQRKRPSSRTGILVAKVVGSKTWFEGYLVVLASRVWRKVFAKLSSLILSAVCVKKGGRGSTSDSG